MKIHVLGVCGTYMGGVAQLAKSLGHQVEGSDLAYYEPMAGQLAKAGIQCHEGYDTNCVAKNADLYIVGNVVSRGNPLFEEMLRQQKHFCSGPDWIAKNFLAANKKVIAVAGTHGKTTTTAMIIHILERAGLAPGYLVGGVLSNGRSAEVGSKEVAVIEADEYDTALFDKRPKFTHYWSDAVVLNNIEFDHSDIYPDLAAIKRQFSLLPRTVKPDGAVVANWSDANVREVLAESTWHRIVRTKDSNGWSIRDGNLVGPDTDIELKTNLPLGSHNQDNFLAAVAACATVGVKATVAVRAMEDFNLPMRRMQLIHSQQGVDLIDDFAHHPTSIDLVIKAARESYGDRRLVLLFEPRSNTMRSGHWQGQLAGCLVSADEVLALSTGIDWDLEAALAPLGDKASVFEDPSELESAAVESARLGETVMLMLSNGDFHGLRESLPKALVKNGTG